MVDGQAGKGSKYRKVDQKQYDENWEKIFVKKKVKDKDNGKSKKRARPINRKSS